MDVVTNLLQNSQVLRELDDMPILKQYINKFDETSIFKGKRIGMAHVLAPNTVVMIAALLKGGAELEIIVNNGLTHSEETITLLEDSGVQLYQNHPDFTYDFVIDCTGYFTNHHPNIGGVEVTRTGIHRYNALEKPSYILIDVDSTKTKMIETFLGNPEGVYLTLDFFVDDVDTFLRNKKIAIVGFGKIGRGSARKFREFAEITIVDILSSVLQKAQNLGFKTYLLQDNEETNSRFLTDYDIIITATGRYGVMTKHFDKSTLGDILKINLGAVDEWGDNYSEEEIFHSKHQPFNFNMSPPTPSKYIDPILALHIDGLEYLISNQDTLSNGCHVIPKTYDDSIIDQFNNLYDYEANLIDEYF